VEPEKTALIDTVKIEKILLAKKVGQFLVQEQIDEERVEVEKVARRLASDVSVKVRRVLAFELRRCTYLVPDIAEKIAGDVEAVAGPFLAVTQAITDKAFLRLLPQLEDYAIAVLARRSDLSEFVVHALSQMGNEGSVRALVRNDHLRLGEPTCNIVVNRFGGNIHMMDQFSARSDLPVAVVERIVDKVSDHCRDMLVEQYAVSDEHAGQLMDSCKLEFLYEQLTGADAEQVHACVTELRSVRRLSHWMVVELAGRGCLTFMESALALEAGLPRGSVKKTLGLGDPSAFVKLMQMANVSKTMAPRFLKIAKEFYGSNELAA